MNNTQLDNSDILESTCETLEHEKSKLIEEIEILHDQIKSMETSNLSYPSKNLSMKLSMKILREKF